MIASSAREGRCCLFHAQRCTHSAAQHARRFLHSIHPKIHLRLIHAYMQPNNFYLQLPSKPSHPDHSLLDPDQSRAQQLRRLRKPNHKATYRCISYSTISVNK